MSTLNTNNISPLSGNNVIISGSLTVTGNISGSITNALTASYALNGGGSTNTSSLLVTASFSDPNLTFEKGDGSTFGIDISTLTVTNASTASYIDGANVNGYVNNANNADLVFTTTSMLPPGNYPILFGSPGIVDNFSGVYSKTNLSFNQPINTFILTQVSESLDFADDAAAALGGVPLGGLYRNGNLVLIRIV